MFMNNIVESSVTAAVHSTLAGKSGSVVFGQLRDGLINEYYVTMGTWDKKSVREWLKKQFGHSVKELVENGELPNSLLKSDGGVYTTLFIGVDDEGNALYYGHKNPNKKNGMEYKEGDEGYVPCSNAFGRYTSAESVLVKAVESGIAAKEMENKGKTEIEKMTKEMSEEKKEKIEVSEDMVALAFQLIREGRASHSDVLDRAIATAIATAKARGA